MKNLTILFAVIAVIMLTGCTTPYYPEPRANQPHAVIKPKTVRSGLFSTADANIFEINRQPVKDIWRDYTAKRRIAPGPTTLFVEALIPGEVTAFGELSFNAEAGKHYSISYTNTGPVVDIFILNEQTREPVSTIQAHKQREVFHWVPVYIPSACPSFYHY